MKKMISFALIAVLGLFAISPFVGCGEEKKDTKKADTKADDKAADKADDAK
jgi:hypothetical protein